MSYREVIRCECGCWQEFEGLDLSADPVAKGYCDEHKPRPLEVYVRVERDEDGLPSKLWLA